MQCNDFSCFLSCLCVAVALSDPLSGEGAAAPVGEPVVSHQAEPFCRLPALSELEGES